MNTKYLILINELDKIFLSTYCAHTGKRYKRNIKQAFRFDEEILVFVKQAGSNTSFCVCVLWR